MDSPQSMTSPPPHLYSQSLQVRLYQAFVFSIPILFSIILFLLFYLFYLKKSSNPASTPQPTLPQTSNQAPLASSSEMVLKGEKLELVLFNEDVRTSYSTCCVCLGEFVVGEELHRIATCRHVFHMDCICNWLHSNPTCPLCRCFIASTTKHSRNTLVVVSPHQQEHIVMIPTEMLYIL